MNAEVRNSLKKLLSKLFIFSVQVSIMSLSYSHLHKLFNLPDLTVLDVVIMLLFFRSIYPINKLENK